jgi:hypothetical protein
MYTLLNESVNTTIEGQGGLARSEGLDSVDSTRVSVSFDESRPKF